MGTVSVRDDSEQGSDNLEAEVCNGDAGPPSLQHHLWGQRPILAEAAPPDLSWVKNSFAKEASGRFPPATQGPGASLQ